MPIARPHSSSLSRLRERAGVRVRGLRTRSTDAERCLWHQLRGRRMEGFQFCRQHPIGAFIADFACIEAGLVIELDGGQHFDLECVVADQRRSAALAQAGFAVLRFHNRQMLQETDGVLASIRNWLLREHPHPNPLPQVGEGVHARRLT